MSQYQPALNYVLDWEDAKRQYRILPDNKGYAVSGVNSIEWPLDYKNIAAALLKDRPQLIYNFYQNQFWNPMKLGALDFQDVANRIMDEGVNTGSATAIKLLQKSLVSLHQALAVDGVMGPDTWDATNAQDPEILLATFRNSRLMYYKRIIDNNPQDATYFAGWEKRALA
jgi:lysozyme family protein